MRAHTTGVLTLPELEVDLPAMARRLHRGGRPRGLSRLERLGESGFAKRSEFLTERCPACQDNELSPPSPYDPNDSEGRTMGRVFSTDCEVCDGHGVVPRAKKFDPYMTPSAQYG